MEDCENKWEQNSTNSVIAKLMGLDELQPQQSVHEKRRVLSESYVRKAASIGLRPGSLVSDGLSHSTKKEIVNEVNVVYGVHRSKSKNDNILEKVEKGISVSKSSSRASHGKRRSLHVLRYMQKLEHDKPAGHLGELGVDYRKKSLNNHLEMIDKPQMFSTSISAFKPKSDLDVVKSDLHREFLRPESGNNHHGLTYRKLGANGNVSTRHSCISCTHNMNRISRQEKGRSKFEEVSKPKYLVGNCIVNKVEAPVPSFPGASDYKNGSHVRHLLLDQSSLTNESEKKKIEWWKKDVQQVRVSGRHLTLDEMLALADKRSMSRSLNKLKEQTVFQKDILEPKRGRGCERFQTSDGVDDIMLPSSGIFDLSPEAYGQHFQVEMDDCYEKGMSREIELNGGICPEFNDDPLSGSNSGILSGEGVDSSYVQDFFSGEASLHEYSEEDSAYSNSSRAGPPEFQDKLKRTNQRSPDSVLEPFDIKNSSTFDYFDSIGLQLQLEALNLETEETYSEGSVMAVSDDEEIEEQLDDLSRDDRKIKRWIGGDQSRNFSYLVDVLEEAGFCGTKSLMDLKTWYLLECPISPLVFEKLERKYGKHISWQKSERRLLFDRINSRLTGICNASVRRKFSASLKRDEVEDQLWTLLISQEKETNKDLSEKDLEKWSELAEGVDIICKDLENSIFDELVVELASLWD